MTPCNPPSKPRCYWLDGATVTWRDSRCIGRLACSVLQFHAIKTLVAIWRGAMAPSTRDPSGRFSQFHFLARFYWISWVLAEFGGCPDLDFIAPHIQYIALHILRLSGLRRENRHWRYHRALTLCHRCCRSYPDRVRSEAVFLLGSDR